MPTPRPPIKAIATRELKKEWNKMFRNRVNLALMDEGAKSVRKDMADFLERKRALAERMIEGKATKDEIKKYRPWFSRDEWNWLKNRLGWEKGA